MSQPSQLRVQSREFWVLQFRLQAHEQAWLMSQGSNKALLWTYFAMPLIESNLCLFYPKAEKQISLVHEISYDPASPT